MSRLARDLRRVDRRILAEVALYLKAECESCDAGIAPEQLPVFAALVRRIRKEIRRRKKKSKNRHGP